MLIERTALPGVLVLTPRRFTDERGYFCETYNRDALRAHGLDVEFVQDNHSMSNRAGTVRGLHFQAPPRAQAKLVRCGRGRLMDVTVDIRNGSPTYGRWVGLELTAENGRQLFIPEGFAHGFVTREPETEIFYKCSDTYAPEAEGVIRFDDPTIGINWGLDGRAPILSDKDAAAPGFDGFHSPFRFEA